MNFKSEHEAYTFMLIKREEIQEKLNNTSIQMDYLLMNIRKGNFNDVNTKKHAMTELDYLISASKELADKAEDLNILAVNLFNDMYERKLTP